MYKKKFVPTFSVCEWKRRIFIGKIFFPARSKRTRCVKARKAARKKRSLASAVSESPRNRISLKNTSSTFRTWTRSQIVFSTRVNWSRSQQPKFRITRRKWSTPPTLSGTFWARLENGSFERFSWFTSQKFHRAGSWVAWVFFKNTSLKVFQLTSGFHFQIIFTAPSKLTCKLTLSQLR